MSCAANTETLGSSSTQSKNFEKCSCWKININEVVILKGVCFDLRTLCREAVETFRLQTPEEVVLDVEKGLPSCTVCQYRQGLMQILANFIRNALKFTPRGFVTVGFERKRDRLSLYVRDTGIGIPAEELDKIFERFYKVDTFTQGTGLGLSICKSIAEQMGAQIGVDSAVGEGSCFRVEMPIAE